MAPNIVPNPLRARDWLLLLLLGLALFIPGLPTIPPLDRDEPRYAQASKQMLESGNYHDIHFMAETRYKKPIGIHWLQSASNGLFGPPPYDDILPYRLPSLLGGLMALGFTAWGAARLLGRQGGMLAALILASAALLHFESRIAKTDAMLLACSTGAQFILALAYRGNISNRLATGFWLLQALAILIKGPIAPLVSLLTIGTLWAVDRRASWLAQLRPWRGMALTALLVLPWFISIGISSGGKFYGESVDHDLLGKIFTGQDRGWLPPGYHTLLLPLLFLPQITLILQGLVTAWQRRAEPIPRFALAWILPLWLLYELIATKLPHYVLPAYPALALLAALALQAPPRVERGWRIVQFLQSIALGMGMVALAVGALRLPVNPLVTAVVLMVGSAAVVMQARLAFRWPLIGCLAGGAAAAALYIGLFGIIAPASRAYWLSPQIASAFTAARHCPLTSKLVTEGYNEPSLVFLAGTPTRFANGGALAAQLITQDPCSLAIVRDDIAEPFWTEMALLRRTALPLATITGYNYNGGGWQHLTLYRAAPPDGQDIWPEMSLWPVPAPLYYPHYVSAP